MSYQSLYAYLAKHKRLFTSLLLSVYCFPLFFTRNPDDNIDGSWMRALNMAIHKHLVFGRDLIFTYGPLGFLNTRNPRHINTSLIFAGDIFLFAGFLYFIYKYHMGRKGWLIISLVSMLLLRDAQYTQTLFLLYALYTASVLCSGLPRYFELWYLATASVLLFFIKINYGLVCIGFSAVVAVALLITHRLRAAFFAGVALLTFLIAWQASSIDIAAYMRNSIELFVHYDEAMSHVLPLTNAVFLSACALLLLFAVFVVRRAASLAAGSALTPGRLMALAVICVVAALFYKNGFTRADDIHYYQFFTVAGFLTVALLFIFGQAEARGYKLAAIVVLLISGINVLLPQVVEGSINLRLATPVTYFTDIFLPPNIATHQSPQLNSAHKALLAANTVDIFPDRIAFLDDNGLNYAPRPVIQSYTVYSPMLDSINASHFSSAQRPAYVLAQAGQFDNRYDFWNESLTKAALHLNYSVKEADVAGYLLLQARNTDARPAFDNAQPRTARLTDTITVGGPGNAPHYFTANLSYTAWGKLMRLCYQAPQINIVLILDDGSTREYQAIVPILRTPCLISKYIATTASLADFFNSRLQSCPGIRAFTFKPLSPGFAAEYELTFLRFANY